MFFHRTCDCSDVRECNHGEQCHKYDDVKCGNGICKYLFGNDWGLVFNLLIISHLALIKTQKFYTLQPAEQISGIFDIFI